MRGTATTTATATRTRGAVALAMTTAKGKTKYLGKKVLNSTQNEVLITALLLEQTSVNGPSQEEVIFIYLFINVNNFFRILCAFLLLPYAENF